MKVLVTGGTGTISSGIVEASVKMGYEVYYITRGNKEYRNIEGANNIVADVWNTKELAVKLKNMSFDIVVECLAYSIEQLKISLENFKKICNQYVFISTAGIYGRKAGVRIKENDSKTCIEWDYTRQKIECEKYLIDNSDKFTFNYTIIRPVVTYGNYRIPYSVVSRYNQWTLCDRMLKKQPIIACNNIKFSIIHIDDFSRAVVGLFGNKKAYNEDFHISTSKNELFWDDVIYAMDEILGTRTTIIHLPLNVYQKIFPNLFDELQYNKSTELLMNDEKLCDALGGFESTVNVKEGLSKTIDTLREEYMKCEDKIDDYFNFESDMCIYYSVKKKILCKEEYEKAAEYINSWDLDKLSSVKKAVRSRQIKYYIKKIRYLKE